MAVRVTLAGRVGVEVDGKAVGEGEAGRLGQLALAYLVCERRRPVPRDELAELLWGEGLPRSWAQLLRGIMSKLRATLAAAGLNPNEALPTGAGAWQLHLPADATVDIEEAAAALEAAATADPAAALGLASSVVAVASRQFLPGASGAWVERRQGELRELHLRGLEALAGAAESTGRFAAAVAAAEDVAAIEPFRESAYLRLMSSHAGAGNRGEALRAYERCRRTLADELGVSPSPATEAAYVALLGDGPPAAPEAPASPAVPFPLPPALEAAPNALFVGRENEVSRLAEALDRTASGRRCTVLVGGEPGIGKTTLVSALARQAHARGARVLYGHCDDGLGMAYQPFAEAAGQLVASSSTAELTAHAAVHGGELCRLTPELARRLPDLAPPALTDPEADRFRMFEALADLVAAASRAALVVLVIDDLHWATSATLLLLRHLVHSATPAALLIAGTYRHSEVGPDHPFTATLADLRRDPQVERIGLDGLDRAGVVAYVEAAGGPPVGDGQASLAEAIHAHTAGNPFFVGELLRHLAETGAVYRKEGPWSYYADAEGLSVPEGVREVVARRIRHLSEPAGRALVWASVIGAEFDLDVLESVVDPAEAEGVLDSVEEAVASRLLSELGLGRYGFAHALVRDAIYSSLTATRRARLHYRVGQAIESLPGDPEPRLAALAQHFAEAGSAAGASRAADYALAAAARAFAQAAWEDAIALLERGGEAIELSKPPDLERRCDLALSLAEAWTRLWDPAPAAEASLRAAEAARALGSAEGLAKAARWYYTVGGDRALGGAARPALTAGPGLDPAVRVGQIGRTLADEALAALGDTAPALRAMVLAAVAKTGLRGVESVDDLSREALSLARRSGDLDALGAALNTRCQVLASGVHAHEHLALAEELVSASPPGGWDGWRSGLVQRAMARLKVGDRVGFDADAAAVHRMAVERRFWAIRVSGLTWRATRALLDGRFDEVEDLAQAVVDASPRGRFGVGETRSIQMFRLHYELGQRNACRGELDRALADYAGNPIFRAMLGVTHAERGEIDQAIRAFDVLAARGFALVPPLLWPVTLAYLAELTALLGDGGRAGPVWEGLAPYAGQAVASGAAAHCPGAVDRFLGQLATTLGDFDEAESRYQAAVALETALRAPPLLARTRYWYGRMLLARGGPGDAERAAGLLEYAVETAERLGMAALAGDARGFLVSA